MGDAIAKARDVKDKRDDVQKQKEKLDKELEEKKAMMQAILEQTTSSERITKQIQEEEMAKKRAEIALEQRQKEHEAKMKKMQDLYFMVQWL